MINEYLTKPNKLAKYYSKFDVENKLLFTGHSHQAWPDKAFEGMLEYHQDAAELADNKWERASAKVERVKSAYRKVLGDISGHITIAQNTHEVLVRFLSALPLAKKPKLITTNGEFHTIRRQFDRLSEENWIEIKKVDAYPANSVAERIIAEIDDKTSAVFVSSVYFQNAVIVQGIKEIYDACQKHGCEMLIDTYHQLNAVPFSVDELGIENAYIIGGGYKYMQFGEGNCFIRFPKNSELRPIYTGWFSEFGELHKAKISNQISYGEGDLLFAGSTYDPISQYRAATVADFFEEQQLTPELLREISQNQIGLMMELFDELDLNPKDADRERNYRLEDIGGFFVVLAENASELQAKLWEKGVLTDSRGKYLRFGPAPYHNDDQIKNAFDIFGSLFR